MKIKKVYIAGKYTSKTRWGIKRNIKKARKAGIKIIKELGGEGFYPIIPHSNTALMDNLQSYDYFLAGTLEQLKECEYIYMVDGWLDSNGATKELEFAKKHGIKRIIYTDNKFIII